MNTTVAIVNYGVGNLRSVENSFAAIGVKADVVADPEAICRYNHILLPGVGAFGDAANKLFHSGMAEAVTKAAQKGVPLLGVCLGMQLLLEKSFEYGEHRGLGLIPGEVRSMEEIIPQSCNLKIPKMGWNGLIFPQDRPKSPLFSQVNEGECVYFVHSYYAKSPAPFVSAVDEYGAMITAAVERENIFGTQFHPEKSGNVGLKILKTFCEM